MRVAIELSNIGAVEGLQIEYVDISPLPLLNTDLENGKEGTFPREVEAFRHKILPADTILFASPEYNYSVSGMYTQMFDFLLHILLPS